MAPTPTGTAFCMASPRVRSSRAVSEMLKAPAAASAEYSPSEGPATKAASRPTEKPASLPSTRSLAIETAISAGWAFSVSCRVSAGPSQIVAVSFSPSAASTSSNTAFAAGKASASALPMPTPWEPCPGKVNAAVIGAPRTCRNASSLGRKTPLTAVLSSYPAEQGVQGCEFLEVARPGPPHRRTGTLPAGHDAGRGEGYGAGLLTRDELRMGLCRALALCLRMIFSENRCTLFRIMRKARNHLPSDRRRPWHLPAHGARCSPVAPADPHGP